ncbi:hypothetical protein BH24ACT1_BH24ACT1_01980 [soil metagenome]
MTATGSTAASDTTAPTSRAEGFQALGFTFSVDTDDSVMALGLDQILGSLAIASRPRHSYAVVRCGNLDSSGGPYRITLDAEQVAVVPSSARAVDHLLWHINRQVLERTDDLVLVHAGAVAGRAGGIVLPAPSGSGKSTVVAGLIRAGMRYLTDEAVAIDPATLALHPYPKPLSLDQVSLQALAGLDPPFDGAGVPEGGEKSHVPAATFGADSLVSPCPPAFVIEPCYSPNPTNRILPLGRAHALVQLAQNSFNLASFGPTGFLALARLVRQSACYRLEFNDLGRACALVLDLVEQVPQPQPQPLLQPAATSRSVGGNGRELAGDFRPTQRAGLLTVELDGEAVILDEVTQAVHALNLTGTLVWRVADGTSTLDELVAWLSESYALPADDVRQQVIELVLDLIDNELLCQS